MTAVELAVALAIVGLLAWQGVGALEATQAQRARAQAKQEVATMRDRLRTFALQNKRLPCPDQTGSGWEGDATGACGSAVTGWLPYRTLGLDLPSQALRMAYAVYRVPNAADPSADADLALALERTGNAPGEAAYQDVHDLIRALQNGANQTDAAVVPTQPYVTGNGGATGVIDCVGNRVANVAFRLIVPLDDLSQDGNRFDGVNDRLAVCSQGPDAARKVANDDVVLTEGFSALAGWLYARAL
jgi:type II secretory pathway pseudopilin PulG